MYSPELNPCELVFNVIKLHIRNHRNFGVPIWQEVINSITKVGVASMIGFYEMCVVGENCGWYSHL